MDSCFGLVSIGLLVLSLPDSYATLMRPNNMHITASAQTVKMCSMTIAFRWFIKINVRGEGVKHLKCHILSS